MRIRRIFGIHWLLAVALVGVVKWVMAAEVERVGTYDSRLIAYAAFWSSSHQQEIKAKAAAAEAAKAEGNTTRFNELRDGIKAEQAAIHLQVFSTAPADAWLTGISNQVATIKKEKGLTRLVSKWDDQALKHYPAGQQIDVTEDLLKQFSLTEKQLKVIRELKAKKPLPFDKAKQLEREGRF